jgi:hypothetical protein
MNINTEFCLELLRLARRDAKAYNVTLPRGLVALQSGRDQWFVQGAGGDPGRYVKGDNAFEARANYILAAIRDKHPQYDEAKEEETAPALPASPTWCKCGHISGQHGAAFPHRCACDGNRWINGRGTVCDCQGFEAARA